MATIHVNYENRIQNTRNCTSQLVHIIGSEDPILGVVVANILSLASPVFLTLTLLFDFLFSICGLAPDHELAITNQAVMEEDPPQEPSSPLPFSHEIQRPLQRPPQKTLATRASLVPPASPARRLIMAQGGLPSLSVFNEPARAPSAIASQNLPTANPQQLARELQSLRDESKSNHERSRSLSPESADGVMVNPTLYQTEPEWPSTANTLQAAPPSTVTPGTVAAIKGWVSAHTPTWRPWGSSNKASPSPSSSPSVSTTAPILSSAPSRAPMSSNPHPFTSQSTPIEGSTHTPPLHPASTSPKPRSAQ